MRRDQSIFIKAGRTATGIPVADETPGVDPDEIIGATTDGSQKNFEILDAASFFYSPLTGNDGWVGDRANPKATLAAAEALITSPSTEQVVYLDATTITDLGKLKITTKLTADPGNAPTLAPAGDDDLAAELVSNIPDDLSILRYLGGKWVGITGNATVSGLLVYSDDGINWTEVPVSSFPWAAGNGINDLFFYAGKWFAGGEGSIVYSSDLVSWTSSSHLSAYSASAVLQRFVGEMNGIFYALGYPSDTLAYNFWTSTDGGLSWTTLGGSTGVTHAAGTDEILDAIVSPVQISGSNVILFVGHESSVPVIYTFNGSTSTNRLAPGAGTACLSIVSGENEILVTETDGSTWYATTDVTSWAAGMAWNNAFNSDRAVIEITNSAGVRTYVGASTTQIEFKTGGGQSGTATAATKTTGLSLAATTWNQVATDGTITLGNCKASEMWIWEKELLAIDDADGGLAGFILEIPSGVLVSKGKLYNVDVSSLALLESVEATIYRSLIKKPSRVYLDDTTLLDSIISDDDGTGITVYGRSSNSTGVKLTRAKLEGSLDVGESNQDLKLTSAHITGDVISLDPTLNVSKTIIGGDVLWTVTKAADLDLDRSTIGGDVTISVLSFSSVSVQEPVVLGSYVSNIDHTIEGGNIEGNITGATPDAAVTSIPSLFKDLIDFIPQNLADGDTFESPLVSASSLFSTGGDDRDLGAWAFDRSGIAFAYRRSHYFSRPKRGSGIKFEIETLDPTLLIGDDGTPTFTHNPDRVVLRISVVVNVVRRADLEFLQYLYTLRDFRVAASFYPDLAIDLPAITVNGAQSGSPFLAVNVTGSTFIAPGTILSIDHSGTATEYRVLYSNPLGSGPTTEVILDRLLEAAVSDLQNIDLLYPDDLGEYTLQIPPKSAFNYVSSKNRKFVRNLRLDFVRKN